MVYKNRSLQYTYIKATLKTIRLVMSVYPSFRLLELILFTKLYSLYIKFSIPSSHVTNLYFQRRRSPLIVCLLPYVTCHDGSRPHSKSNISKNFLNWPCHKYVPGIDVWINRIVRNYRRMLWSVKFEVRWKFSKQIPSMSLIEHTLLDKINTPERNFVCLLLLQVYW